MAQLCVPAFETIYGQKTDTDVPAYRLNAPDATAAEAHVDSERVAAPAQARPTTTVHPQHVN